MFFTSLLKSLVCIAVILGVGFASYKISYSVLSGADENGSDPVDRDRKSVV